MSAKMTPGPWSYAPDINRVFSVPTDMIVASIHVAGNPACEESWPTDARVIAAAPEMLEALKALHHEFDQLYDGPEHPLNCLVEQMGQVRAAIAKAEGRS